MRVIHEEPMQIGGEIAKTELPKGHEGACKVVVDSTNETICVLPNLDEAESAAAYAITQDGGYGSTKVEPANVEEVTHSSWQDWSFDL